MQLLRSGALWLPQCQTILATNASIIEQMILMVRLVTPAAAAAAARPLANHSLVPHCLQLNGGKFDDDGDGVDEKRRKIRDRESPNVRIYGF